MRLATTLLVLLISLFPKLLCAEACKKYESTYLIGTIVRQTFPGRPNYESVAKGDEAEKVWVLHLLTPACVQGNGSDPEEKNISDVQLVLNEKQYQQYRDLVGKIVSASGTIFHSETGHHHTKVLLTVTSLNEPIVN